MRPRDTRSFEIKKLLKKQFPNATFKVWIHKYSMGESINIKTDAITRKMVPDPRGYGYVYETDPQSQSNKDAIESMLRSYKHVDRDQWGEILSGGNTYLFVEPMN